MPLESDLSSLIQTGIISNDIAETITAGVSRERGETLTKNWCPLADQLENMIEKASANPNRANDLLIEVLTMINERNSHFGE